jgi:hypothetical protein
MPNPKLNLPEKYLKWLGGLGEEPYVKSGGCEWELATREMLLDPVDIDGNEAPYIEQAKLLVRSIVQATGGTHTVDQDGNEIPNARMEGFLTIGYDNENLLCVDPSDGFSVWCFRPGDGGDVEKLADSLDQWMEEAEASE